MTAPGRKPLPTNVHILNGRKDKVKEREKARGGAEASAPRGIPPMPDHFDVNGYAAFKWNQLTELLDKMGVLTLGDATALERLCEAYADVRECEEKIEADGYTYWSHSEHGSMIKANPAVAQKRAAEAQLKAYLAEFGLTPSARSRVKGDGGGTPPEGDGGDGILD